MGEEWVPRQESVEVIVGLLTEFQSPGANQNQIFHRLNEWCTSYGDFPNYLAYVFVKGDGLPVEVRQSAGLLLKNNLRTVPYKDGDPGRSVVRLLIGEGLCFRDTVLRHTAASCASAIVASSGFVSWPDLVQTLWYSLRSNDADRIEGALDVIQKAWEDAPVAMSESGRDDQASAADVLLPQTLPLFSSDREDIKVGAIEVMNQGLYNECAVMAELLDGYKNGLFSLAHDLNPRVRKVVCIGLRYMTELAPSYLESQVVALIDYMIHASQDENEEVALEASEFWSVLPEAGFDVHILEPFTNKIIPLLLNNMRYDEFDDEVADAEADEEAALAGRAVDKDSELKPHIHTDSRGNHGGDHGDDNDDDDDNVEEGKWNLRRSAAAGLDMLSGFMHDDMLPILLPAVQIQLQQPDWRAREAAILALGAVSEGCHTGLSEHIQSIIGVVLPHLIDPRPMIRCISCWTLTRYSRQLYARQKEGDSSLLHSVVNGVVERAEKDHNKKVQISACGSLATLVEEDTEGIQSYIQQIVHALSHGLQSYSRRALRAVYDALNAVAASTPDVLQRQDTCSILLIPLFNKLDTIPDGDVELLPLLECIGRVGVALKTNVLPFAESTFRKTMTISEKAFIAAESGAMDPDEAYRFIQESLDTLAFIIEGAGPAVAPLIQKSSLGPLLVKCATHSDATLRQSAFGVLGDVSRAAIVEILPYLSPLLTAALDSMKPENLTSESVDACSNAIWAIGILATVCSSEDVQQFSLLALERLTVLLTAPMGAIPWNLMENIAVTLGRLASATPQTLAPHAHVFLPRWCTTLRNLRYSQEKIDAFDGLCDIIKTNPDAGAAHFKSICECFASWKKSPGDALQQQMTGIIQGYVREFTANNQWEATKSTISPTVLEKLHLA